MAGRQGGRDNSSIVLFCMVLILLLKPDQGFTRGRARKTRQVQYLACPYFPECHTYPIKESEALRRFWRRPRCDEHGAIMDEPVVWKPR